MPSRWSFARRHMLDTADVDSDVTRRHQRDETPRWCRGEHATAGADQTLGLRPVTLASEGRPLLAVSGSSWGPARSVVASSLDGVWSLAIAGVHGQSAAPQSSCPGPHRSIFHSCRTAPCDVRFPVKTTVNRSERCCVDTCLEQQERDWFLQPEPTDATVHLRFSRGCEHTC